MEPVKMTREQFLKISPAARTRIDAPLLITRILPDGTVLRAGVMVELIN